ncbi:hypothetical protein [Phytohabitans kaempferiae]|uniref:Uncharacterized protein n=1 Tax=Phytohabitans kaempferiae TaxID=1620943 RepID=A0ABV6MBI6_9ACTN
MPDLPDFSAMTTEQVGDWFLRTDTTALLAQADHPTEPMVHVNVEEKPIRVPKRPSPSATTDHRKQVPLAQ